MVLVKNLKFCERFVLSNIHPEKVFGDALVRKIAFLDNINMDLNRRQNDFGQKFEISSTLIFVQNRPRKRIWERSS